MRLPSAARATRIGRWCGLAVALALALPAAPVAATGSGPNLCGLGGDGSALARLAAARLAARITPGIAPGGAGGGRAPAPAEPPCCVKACHLASDRKRRPTG